MIILKTKTAKMALTGGLIWGVLLFLTTLISVYSGYASQFLQLIADVYPGYSVTLSGSIIGLIYGFLDIYIGVYIVSWVYHHIGK